MSGYSDEEIWEMALTFLRDDPNQNLLLGAREFSRKEYDLAKKMALAAWDTTLPIGGGLDSAHMPLPTLVKAIAAWLLQSASFLQLRNQVSMNSDHNEAIGLDDKAPLYAQMGGQLMQQVTFEIQRVKTALNMQLNGFGHISSRYRSIGRRY